MKNGRTLAVGDDPQIVPLGAAPERSGKTYTAIPSALGPMWAAGPYGGTFTLWETHSSMVWISGMTSSRASRTMRAVSREVKVFTPFWTAHSRMARPSS